MDPVVVHLRSAAARASGGRIYVKTGGASVGMEGGGAAVVGLGGVSVGTSSSSGELTVIPELTPERRAALGRLGKGFGAGTAVGSFASVWLGDPLLPAVGGSIGLAAAWGLHDRTWVRRTLVWIADRAR